jgi:hypothetical protein
MRVALAILLLTSACVDDDDALRATASGYPGFARINARPFATRLHQGNPLVNVWTNGTATDPYLALSAGAPAPSFPVGAMIVKEMLDPAGGPPILTVMAKQAAGYDPVHADWWYARLDANGDATSASLVGRVGFCVACHAGAPGYVYGVAADNLAPR